MVRGFPLRWLICSSFQKSVDDIALSSPSSNVYQSGVSNATRGGRIVGDAPLQAANAIMTAASHLKALQVVHLLLRVLSPTLGSAHVSTSKKDEPWTSFVLLPSLR